MSGISVTTSQGEYSVRVGTGLAAALAHEADAVIVDRALVRLLPEINLDRVIAVNGGEACKTLEACEEILTRMHDLGVRRSDRLAAVGGGSVQDVGTFVASVYMRGIPWAYAPSTAMAMLDSCVGGKSSINVGGIKNLVGNIYPPSAVVIDTSLLVGLELEARISGLAEAVKICFCRGGDEFASYMELAPSAEELGEEPSTKNLILHVLAAKKWFLEIDEHDRKERQMLNFGHTFAHALESATGFAVPHGVAVAVGILAACVHPAAARNASTVVLEGYCRVLLQPLRSVILGVIERLDWQEFDRAVASDKKGTHEHVRLILPAKRGGVALVELPRTESTFEVVRDSMLHALHEVAQ